MKRGVVSAKRAANPVVAIIQKHVIVKSEAALRIIRTIAAVLAGVFAPTLIIRTGIVNQTARLDAVIKITHITVKSCKVVA